ncbi:MAG: asparagine synthase (glutamine-hydrolyzing) [Anaerolineales bacterium]|nr:asparagine synthase (glutamine-hydrolyzing) [Anaerolineales bacterium]
MCGICGIWNSPDPDKTSAMVAAMHHRGPDDSGMFSDDCISLGMARLAIIDLSPAAHQPMSNVEQTIWIVFNGEIYNFRSERSLLEAKGYTFHSHSDTEVVLRMYEYYGDDFLLRLRGMFALAIYDRRGGMGRERLLLARDHMGIKPLLYARAGDKLMFASELKALLASGQVKREIDPIALRQLLTFGSVYQPRTMLQGVRMLLPAHRMIVEGGAERIERYWSLDGNRWPDLRQRPYQQLVEELAEVLEESVHLQMVSDVPLGAFLSGGVDSSLLVAMMARIAGKRIKTFSVGFDAEGAALDESSDAQSIARFLGTEHTAVTVRGEEVRDHIQCIARGLDQPSVDGVNSYFVSKAARQGVTVAISGTGGDELFAGYPWFAAMALSALNSQRSPWLTLAWSLAGSVFRQPIFDPLCLTFAGNVLHIVRSRSDFVSQYSNTYNIFGVMGAGKLLSPELRDSAQAGRAAYYDLLPCDEIKSRSPLARVSSLCLRGYTTNQLLRDIDTVSMSHSLEVRVPFLDPVVADFALSLPDSSKIGDLTKVKFTPNTSYKESGVKRIVIDVGRPLLPKDLDKQPKRGFAMPFGAWLKGPLHDVMMDTLDEIQVRQRGLLDVSQVSTIKQSFFEGRTGWTQPWLLMMLELWFREVLDRSLVSSDLAG